MTEKFKMIYLVDDDDIIIYLSNVLIHTMGYSREVKTFSDPRKALDSLISAYKSDCEVPDFILLDINMPEINAWAFLDEMKRNKVKLPVIILSSSIDPEDKERARNYKAVQAFISKPLTRWSLDKIDRLVDDCSYTKQRNKMPENVVSKEVLI